MRPWITTRHSVDDYEFTNWLKPETGGEDGGSELSHFGGQGVSDRAVSPVARPGSRSTPTSDHAVVVAAVGLTSS